MATAESPTGLHHPTVVPEDLAVEPDRSPDEEDDDGITPHY